MRKLLYKKHKILGNKGFSLIELIIVIAIMAVLMAVLAPQLIKYVEKSRIQSDNTAAAELLNVVKIALTDEDIYTLVDEADTITWTGGTGVIVATSAAKADIEQEITDTLGGLTQTVKSNFYKGEVYTIDITITDGVATAAGVWSVTPAT